jgi:hypothetical protein
MITASAHLPAAEHHAAAVSKGNQLADLLIDDTDEAMGEGNQMLSFLHEEEERLASNLELKTECPTFHQTTSNVPPGLSAKEQFELKDDPKARQDNKDGMYLEDSQCLPTPHTPSDDTLTTSFAIQPPRHNASIMLTLTPRKRQKFAEGSGKVVFCSCGNHGHFDSVSQFDDPDNSPVPVGRKRKRPAANNDLARKAAHAKSTPRCSKKDDVVDSIGEISQHIPNQPKQMQEVIAANQHAMLEVMQPMTQSITMPAAAITELLKQ